MKRSRVLATLVVVALGLGQADPSFAHGGAMVSFFPITRTRVQTWTTVKTFPYAIWDARSESAPGTEVGEGTVESAPLLAHELYAIDRDLVNPVRVWLPKGGLLVKMGGPPGDWYCTWRFDFKSAATQQDVDQHNVKGLEYELCVEAGADGMTTKARVMMATFGSLMTISHDDSGATRYRDDVQDYNAVKLNRVDSALLPVLARYGVTSFWDTKSAAVCLSLFISDFTARGPCFAGVGQSLQFGGGSYTLTSLDTQHFKIRIDRPFYARGIVPPGGVRPE